MNLKQLWIYFHLRLKDINFESWSNIRTNSTFYFFSNFSICFSIINFRACQAAPSSTQGCYWCFASAQPSTQGLLRFLQPAATEPLISQPSTSAQPSSIQGSSASAQPTPVMQNLPAQLPQIPDFFVPKVAVTTVTELGNDAQQTQLVNSRTLVFSDAVLNSLVSVNQFIQMDAHPTKISGPIFTSLFARSTYDSPPRAPGLRSLIPIFELTIKWASWPFKWKIMRQLIFLRSQGKSI